VIQREPDRTVFVDPDQRTSAEGQKTVTYGSSFLFPFSPPKPDMPGIRLNLRDWHPVLRYRLLRFGRNDGFDTWLRQNDPTGKSLKSLSSPCARNIPLSSSGKSVI
jgi:hypothetical protein